jgi:tape measure domain-containing protein
MSYSLGDLILELRLDPAAFYGQLEQARVNSARVGAEIGRSLNLNIPKANFQGAATGLDELGRSYGRTADLMRSKPITPTVGDQSLTDLNKHLDKKQSHWAETRKSFESPIKPKVDLTALEELSSRTAAAKTGRADRSQGGKGFAPKSTRSTEPELVSVDAISKASKSVIRSTEGVVSTLIKLPFTLAKAAIDGFVDGVFRTTAQTIFNGVGIEPDKLTRQIKSDLNELPKLARHSVDGIAEQFRNMTGIELPKTAADRVVRDLEDRINRDIKATQKVVDRFSSTTPQVEFKDRAKPVKPKRQQSSESKRTVDAPSDVLEKPIVATVDDQALTDLNKHLDLKQDHWAKVRSDFHTPLNPSVQDDSLAALNIRIDELRRGWGAFKGGSDGGPIKIDRSGVTAAIADIDRLRDQEVQIPVSIANPGRLAQEVEDAIPQKTTVDIHGNLGSVGGGLKSILSGAFSGIGMELSKKFSLGLAGSFERAIGKNFGGLDLIGEALGDKIANGIEQGVSGAGSLVEKAKVAVEGIQDPKMRDRLGAVIEAVQERPKQAIEGIQNAIGKPRIRQRQLEDAGAARQSGGKSAKRAADQAELEFKAESAKLQKMQASKDLILNDIDRQIESISEDAGELRANAAALQNQINNFKPIEVDPLLAAFGEISDVGTPEEQYLELSRRFTSSVNALKQVEQSLEDLQTQKNKVVEAIDQQSFNVQVLDSFRDKSPKKLSDREKENAPIQYREALGSLQGLQSKAGRIKPGLQNAIAQQTEELGPVADELKAAQSRSARFQSRRNALMEGRSKRYETAKANGAGPEELQRLQEDLTRAIGGDLVGRMILKTGNPVVNAKRRFVAKKQSIDALKKQVKLIDDAIAEAQQQTNEAALALDRAVGEAAPREYIELAKIVMGKQFDEQKLPSIKLDSGELRDQAKAHYNPAANQIVIRQEMLEALKSGSALSMDDSKALGEELAHAKDMDFGSVKGLKAFKERRVVGKAAQPTPEEYAAIAPDLDQYSPDMREIELSGKVQAVRAAEKYQQQRKGAKAKIGGIDAVANFAKVEALLKKQQNQLIALAEISKEHGIDVSDFVSERQARIEQIERLVANSKVKTLEGISSGEYSPEKIQDLFGTIGNLTKDISDSIGLKVKGLGKMKAIASTQKQVAVEIPAQFEAVKDRAKTIKAVSNKGALGEYKDVIPDLMIEIKEIGKAKQVLANRIAEIHPEMTQEALDEINHSAQALADRMNEATDAIAQLESMAEENQPGVVAKVERSREIKKQAVGIAKAGFEKTKEMGGKAKAALFNGDRNVDIDVDAMRDGAESIKEGVKKTGKAIYVGGLTIAKTLDAVNSTFQSIAGSDAGQKLLGGMGHTVGALSAATGALVNLANGVERIVLDLTPAGQSLKYILKQTVVPALAIGAAQQLPVIGPAMAGFEHMVGGAVSPLLQAGGHMAGGEAANLAMKAVPDILGLKAQFGAAAAQMVEGAFQNLAGPAAAVLSGKAVMGLGGRAVGAVLPQSGTIKAPAIAAGKTTAALPQSQGTIEAVLPSLNDLTQKQLGALAKQFAVPHVGTKTKKADLIQALEKNVGYGKLDPIVANINQHMDRKGNPVGGFRVDEKELIKKLQAAERQVYQKLKAAKEAAASDRARMLNDALFEANAAIAEIEQLKTTGLSGSASASLGAVQGRLENAHRNRPEMQEAKQAQRNQVAQAFTGPVKMNATTATTIDVGVVSKNSPRLYRMMDDASQKIGKLNEEGAIAFMARSSDNVIQSATNSVKGYVRPLSNKLARMMDVEPQNAIKANLKQSAASPKAKAIAKDAAVMGASLTATHFAAGHGPAVQAMAELGATMGTRAVVGRRDRNNPHIAKTDAAGFAIGKIAGMAMGVIPGAEYLPKDVIAGALAMKGAPMLAGQPKAMARAKGGFSLGDLFGSAQAKAARLEANYQLLIESLSELNGLKFDPQSIPKLKIDNDLLKGEGVDALYDIQENLIIVNSSVARALSAPVQHLKRHANKVKQVVHEAQHALQYKGGTIDTDQAAGGVGVTLDSGQSLSNRQRRAVRKSVDYARQNSPGVDLGAIQALEIDAYAKENRTKEVLMGMRANVDAGLNGVKPASKIKRLIEDMNMALSSMVGEAVDNFRDAIGQKAKADISRTNRAAKNAVKSFDRADQDAAVAFNDVADQQLEKDTRSASRGARKSRRDHFKMAQKMGFTVEGEARNIDLDLDPKEKGVFLGDAIKAVKKFFGSVTKESNDHFRETMESASLQAKVLLADLDTSAIVAEGRGDTKQAEALRGLSARAGDAIAQTDKLTAKVDLDKDDVQKLRLLREEFKGIYDVADRPLPVKLGSGLDLMGQKVFGLINKFRGFGLAILALPFAGVALAGLAKLFGSITSGASEAALETERLTRVINFGSGGSAKGAQNIKELRGQADRLGLDANASLSGYAQFAASTKDTALEGDASMQVFKGVSQAAAINGLKPEQQERVFTALSQMSSKGVVSMEELRQQLGESLPGALSVAARSMNMTTKQFSKMVENGEILSDSFLPKFAQQLAAESSTGVAGAAGSAQASLNRLNNAIGALKVTIGQGMLTAQKIGADAAIVGIAKLVAGLEVLLKVLPAIGLMFAGKFAAGLLAGKALIPALLELLAKIGPMLLKALPAIAAFMTKFLLIQAVIDIFSMVGKAMSDQGGKFREFATSSAQSLKDYETALASARKAQDGFTLSLPKTNRDVKGESLGEGTLIGGIAKLVAGDAGVDFVRKAERKVQKTLGLRTFAEKQAEDRTIAMNETLETRASMNYKVVSQVKVGSSELNQLKDLDKQLESIQARRRALAVKAPEDKQGQRDLKKEETDLLAARERLSKPIGALQQANAAEIETYKASLKELNQLAGEGKITQEEYKTKLEQFQTALAGAEQDQEKLNKALQTSVNSLEAFERAWGKIAAGLEDANTAIKRSNDEARKTIAMAELAGGTQGSAARSSEIEQQSALQKKIQKTRDAIAQMKAELTANDIDTLKVNFGITDETGAAEIKNYADRVTAPKEKALLNNLAQLKSLEADVVGMDADLAEAQVAARRKLIDTTKSVEEFYRSIDRQAKESALDFKKAAIEIKTSNAQNRLSASIKGMQDNYISQYVDGLVDLVGQMQEAVKIGIDQQKEEMGKINNLQDQIHSAQELSKTLPSGNEGMGVGGSGASSAEAIDVAGGESKGAFQSGLYTGPSDRIGGSADYHIDNKVARDLPWNKVVEMFDSMATAYRAQGRNIEFSNSGVAGSIYNEKDSQDVKEAMLKKAFEAHASQARDIAKGQRSIDYYIPKIGKTRFDSSAEGAEQLLPSIKGARVDYGSGGGYGNYATIYDKNGKFLMAGGHGDNSKKLPSSRKLTGGHTEDDGHDHGHDAPMPRSVASGAAYQPNQKHVVIPLDHVRGRIPDKTGGNTYTGSGQTGAAYKGYTERDFQDALAAKAKGKLEQQGYKVTVLKPESFKSFEDYDNTIAKLSKQIGTVVTPLHYDARMSGYSGGYLTRSKAGDSADSQLSNAIYNNMKTSVGSSASSKFAGQDTEANATIKAASAAPATLVEFGAMADLVDRFGTVERYIKSSEFNKALGGYVGGINQFTGGGGGRSQQPITRNAEPQSQVRTSSGAGVLDRKGIDSLMAGGTDSPIAKIIGMAEGNRKADGSMRKSYYGHVDPGNNKFNIGSFSAQGSLNKGTPEASDKAVIEQMLRPLISDFARQAEKTGVALTPKVLFNYLDSYNQSPLAAKEARSGPTFFNSLGDLKGKENDDGAIMALRRKMYEASGQTRIAGLTVKEDQGRRMEEIRAALGAFKGQIPVKSAPALGVMMPTTGMTNAQIEKYQIDASGYADLQKRIQSGVGTATDTTEQSIALSRQLSQSQQVKAKITADRQSRKLVQGLKEGGRGAQDETEANTRQIEDLAGSLGPDTPYKAFRKQVIDLKRNHSDLNKSLTRKEEKDSEALADLKSSLPEVEALVAQGLLPDKMLSTLKAQIPVMEGVVGQNAANRKKLNDLTGKTLKDINEKYKYQQNTARLQLENELNAADIAKSQARAEKLKSQAEKAFASPDDRKKMLIEAATLDRNAKVSQLNQSQKTELKQLADNVRNDPQTYTPEKVAQKKKLLADATADQIKQANVVMQNAIDTLNQGGIERQLEVTRDATAAKVEELRAKIEAIDLAAKDETLLRNDPKKAFELQQQSANLKGQADILQKQVDLSDQLRQQDELVRSGRRTKAEAEAAKKQLIGMSQVSMANLNTEIQQTNDSLKQQNNELDYQSKARVFDIEQQYGAEKVRNLREAQGNGLGALDLQKTIDLGRLQFDLEAKLRDIDLDKTITPEAKKQISDRLREIAKMQTNDITIKATLAREDLDFQGKTLQFQSEMSLNSARGSSARAYGFEWQGQQADKQGAIAQEQYNLADGLRKIDEQARQLGLAPEVVDQLKTNLQSLNEINLQNINAQFNPLVEGLKGIKTAFQGFLGDVISGNSSIGDAFNKMVDNVLNSLSSLAAQLITEQLFGSLFGLGKGIGGAGGGAGGASGGIGGIVASLFGLADGGDVPSINQGNLRDRPDDIGFALRKEGPTSVLGALTPGERVLNLEETKRFYKLGLNSLVSGPRSRFDPSIALRQAAASERGQKVYNFAMGGIVPGAPPVQANPAVGGQTNVNIPISINGGGDQSVNVPRLKNAIEVAVQQELNKRQRPRNS